MGIAFWDPKDEPQKGTTMEPMGIAFGLKWYILGSLRLLSLCVGERALSSITGFFSCTRTPFFRGFLTKAEAWENGYPSNPEKPQEPSIYLF